MSGHIHRLAAPKRYPILRKIAHYLIKVNPGPHSKKDSVPLLIALRDILKIVQTSREAKKVLNARKIYVDGVVRRDPKFPIGLMDVISIPDENKQFRVVFDKHGRISLIEIKDDEAKLKLCKIVNKKKIKGGKTQLNLHDGRNIIVEKDEFKTGDSLLIEIPSQDIKKHLKFEKDVFVYITDGTHVGEFAKISDFKQMPGPTPDRVVLTNPSGESFETLKKYVFVVGKEKPEVFLGE